jgi:(S)-3,5-dihydroxyphenylglycine transaminase
MVATRIRLDDLHQSLTDPVLSSMNFLNEIAERYPNAISFAAGRPFSGVHDTEDLHLDLDAYVAYLKDQKSLSNDQVRNTLFQYGPTKGIIQELIARQLATDENVQIDPASVVVTVGCQEAVFLVLRALRATESDILLAVSPTYVGATGAARMLEMPVVPVRSDAKGIDLTDLVHQIRSARSSGLRPRACYVVTDFANPTGASLTAEARVELVEIASREDILIIEDNPYAMFNGSTTRIPSLKSLDTNHRVVQVGSFAKSCFPGARIGYAVADQVVTGADRPGILADELAKLKSMITVNTSPVAQAMVAGHLLRHDCNLAKANQQSKIRYARNLEGLLRGLERRFGTDDTFRGKVTWNSPLGGFFVVVTVPFQVDDHVLEHSAEDHQVLWTPLRHFYDDPSAANQLRLSCSDLTNEEIEMGLDRLAGLVNEQVSRS